MLKWSLYIMIGWLIMAVAYATGEDVKFNYEVYISSVILLEMCKIAEKLNRLFQRPGRKTYDQLGHLMPKETHRHPASLSFSETE